MGKNKQTGFTLIELLVVIVIIGILSTLALISLNNARAKSRDAKRLADIKQISTALALYYSENNNYPVIITPGNSLESPDGNITYINKIPSNPSPKNDGNCLDKDYQYSTSNNNSKYSLGYCISNQLSDLAGKSHIGSEEGISTCQPITYEEQTYNVVAIGTQCWMASNLNVGVQLCQGLGGVTCSQTPSNINIIEKYCYNNDANVCSSEGALYTWYESVGLDNLNNSDINEPTQGICPTGWHIPTDNDFIILEDYLKDSGSCVPTRSNAGDFNSCKEAGDKLKVNSKCSAVLFKANCNITNFSMPLGGFAWWSHGTFSNRGTHGYLWESTQETNANAWSRNFNNSDAGIARRSFYKEGRFQVRCLKDQN